MNTTNTQDPIARKTPLVELLAAVPADARLVVEVGHGTRYVPIGALCREAIAALQPVAAQPQGDAREAFEAWAQREGFNIQRDDTDKYRDYHTATTRWAWMAWRAARTQASEPGAAGARAVEPLMDEQIASIALETVYEGDDSVPYCRLWIEENGIPFARAIERAHGIGIPATTPTQAAQAEKMEIASRQDACEHWNLLSDGTISQCTKCGARFPKAAQGASNE